MTTTTTTPLELACPLTRDQAAALDAWRRLEPGHRVRVGAGCFIVTEATDDDGATWLRHIERKTIQHRARFAVFAGRPGVHLDKLGADGQLVRDYRTTLTNVSLWTSTGDGSVPLFEADLADGLVYDAQPIPRPEVWELAEPSEIEHLIAVRERRDAEVAALYASYGGEGEPPSEDRMSEYLFGSRRAVPTFTARPAPGRAQLAGQLALDFDAPAAEAELAEPTPRQARRAELDAERAELAAAQERRDAYRARLAARREEAAAVAAAELAKRDARAAGLAAELDAGEFCSGRLRWTTPGQWFAAYRAIIARRCGAPRNAAERHHWAQLIGEAGQTMIGRADLAELAELRADLKTCDVAPYRKATHPRTRAYDLISRRENEIRSQAARAPELALAPEPEPEAEAGPETSHTVYLVACGATKADHAAPARDLYRGDLFKRARRYVEAIGARTVATFKDGAPTWAILSAKHGLLEPETIVSPYDERLPSDWLRRRAWAGRVAQALGVAAGDRVVFLAGRDYRDELWSMLTRAGVACSAPLAGLGIGHQRQRLAELADELDPTPAPLPLFACA
jgi:hypothetical protein